MRPGIRSIESSTRNRGTAVPLFLGPVFVVLAAFVILVYQRFIPAHDSGTVLQRQANDCGPAALTMVLNHFGILEHPDDVRRVFQLSQEGASVSEMIRVAGFYGLKASGWRLSFSALKTDRFPLVILVDGDHFVVVDSVQSERLYVRDPAKGRGVIMQSDLANRWEGTSLRFATD